MQGAEPMKYLLAAGLSVLVLTAGAQFAAAQQPPAPKQRDPVKDLAGLLRSDDVEIRRAAARALSLTRLPITVAIRDLIEALKDPDAVVRDNAVDALAGQYPGRVVDPLIGTLGDPDANARRLAADTLARIGSGTDSAWPSLINLLKDENAEVRKAANAALRRLLGKWDSGAGLQLQLRLPAVW
jgi:HEAT repeat protein